MEDEEFLWTAERGRAESGEVDNPSSCKVILSKTLDHNNNFKPS